MALRTFLAADGGTWTVWLVRPGRSSGPQPGIPEEWLAFQNEDESERLRLREVPPGWEELSDAHLDVLRRMADAVRRPSRGHTAPGKRTPYRSHGFRVVNVSDRDTRRAEFIEALRSAYAARRGVGEFVEPTVRAYARSMREAGVSIAPALVDVKDLVRAHTGYDEPIFTPKVVGWAVAGFFAGSSG